MKNYLQLLDIFKIKGVLKEAYKDIEVNFRAFVDSDNSIIYYLDNLISSRHGHDAAANFINKYDNRPFDKIYKKDDFSITEEAEALMSIMANQLRKFLKPKFGKVVIVWDEAGGISIALYLSDKDLSIFLERKNNTSGVDENNTFERDRIQIEISWDSLKKYGIFFLTGESCAFGKRLLFDLNLEGKLLLESFLGIKITSKPWSSQGVSSILLYPEMLPLIIEFILLFKGYHIIKYNNNSNLYGLYFGFKDLNKLNSLEKNNPELSKNIEKKIINKSIEGSYRGRVQHRMSDRFE